MKRRDDERLEDILRAVEAVEGYVAAAPLTEGVVFDAVRMRLAEIGEAANALPEALRARAPEVEWRDVVGMRNHLVHRCFDTAFAMVEHSVFAELPVLRAAVERLLAADRQEG